MILLTIALSTATSYPLSTLYTGETPGIKCKSIVSGRCGECSQRMCTDGKTQWMEQGMMCLAINCPERDRPYNKEDWK